jgi:hypothetical protein
MITYVVIPIKDLTQSIKNLGDVFYSGDKAIVKVDSVSSPTVAKATIKISDPKTIKDVIAYIDAETYRHLLGLFTYEFYKKEGYDVYEVKA